jgi:hypothetical protein
MDSSTDTVMGETTIYWRNRLGKYSRCDSLQPWEPGKYMIDIIDESLSALQRLEEETTTEEKEPIKNRNSRGRNNNSNNNSNSNNKSHPYRRVLAAQARMVERELLLLWRHAIATHHGLYLADKVERLPNAGCCCCFVQCRATLHVKPCRDCGAVYYCSDACRDYDWTVGQHGRICAMLAAKRKQQQDEQEQEQEKATQQQEQQQEEMQ